MAATVRSILVLSGLFLLSEVAGAHSPTVTQWPTVAAVEIRVVDTTGAAVERAEVLIESPGGARGIAPSAAAGLHRVQLGVGTHLVTVFKPGFEPVSRELRIAAGGPLVVDVTLRPAGLTEQITVIGAPRFEGPAPVSGARMPIAALDLPQSVEVVPQAVLQTQAALSMQDALLNVTGVTPQLGEGRRDQVALRGFSAINDNYIDGVRDDARYHRDLSNLETIEVLKGSASALYGRGSTGGLINRVTKKPLFGQSVTEVSMTAGSFDRRRVQGDLGRSFADDRIAFRLTGAYEDSGSHRPHYALERVAVSPSLAWRSARGTEVLVQTDFLDDSRVPDRGIPSFNGEPVHAARETYFGTPQDDFLDNQVASQSVTLQHPLGSGWQFRNVIRHTWYDNEYSNTQPGATRLVADRIVAARTQYNVAATQRNLFNQTELLATGVLGPLAHTMLVGVEVGREKTRTQRFTGTAAEVDVLNPVLGRPTYAATPSINNGFTGDVAAAYVQEQIIVGRWRALVGGRYDHFDQRLDDLNPANLDLARVDRVFSPRAGIVYRTTAWSSLYASYSRSFQPSGEGLSLAVNTSDLKPEDTLSYEVGAKSGLFGERLSVSAALFRLDRRNVRTRDPIDPNRLVLVGRQRSEGVELNAAGRILPGWDVRGGVTFLDPLILESNDVSSGVPVEGNRIGATANRNANLWTTFSMKNGLTLGGGVFHVGDWFTSNDNLVRLDGYTRVDAMGAYRIGRYEVALNLKNLLDTDYYETSNGNTQIMPAAGINGLVSIRYRW
jgi:catecholate siderophore receptor